MSHAIHIAVLDDEVEITRLLGTYLQGRGFRVTQVHRGADLMALMTADPPALVLLDLGLPGEDGLAIARQLREHFRCGLVIVTGRGDAVRAARSSPCRPRPRATRHCTRATA